MVVVDKIFKKGDPEHHIYTPIMLVNILKGVGLALSSIIRNVLMIVF